MVVISIRRFSGVIRTPSDKWPEIGFDKVISFDQHDSTEVNCMPAHSVSFLLFSKLSGMLSGRVW